MRISILEKIKEESVKKYDKVKKIFMNEDKSLEMIVFAYKTDIRKINDLTEEETNEFIGIHKGEWILYKQKIEFNNGPVKIKDEPTYTMDSNEVLEYINNLDDKEFMCFMRKACEFYPVF